MQAGCTPVWEFRASALSGWALLDEEGASGSGTYVGKYGRNYCCYLPYLIK